MANYRLYFMTNSGHIEGVHEFEAINDDTAMDEAEQKRQIGRMELSSNTRKVSHWDSILDKPSYG